MTDDDNRFHAADDGGPDATGVRLGDPIEALLADPTMWERPPDDLGDRVVAAVRGEAAVGRFAAGRVAPSWVRPALLGAAAVVLFLFGGIVAFSALNGSTGAEQLSADLVPTGLIADVDGSIEMTTFDSGLRIELDAPSLPRREQGRFYEAWLRTDDGLLVPVGTFHGGEAVTLWAGVERDQIVAFTVTLEAAAAGDSVEQRSSGDVVLKADIPTP